MKANEILNKIKNIVGEKVELSEEKIEMAEITLENGTVLVAEKFEAGESIFIKTEDEQIALPIGEYKLEEGKVLVVSEEGLIDSIKEAAEEAVEEELSEESNEEVETELEEEEKEELEYVTKEEFKSAVEEIKGMIEKMGYKDKEEMKEEVIEEVKEEKEELSAVAPEPVKHNPEAEVDNKVNFHIASNRTQTTKDRVFDKIFNNN
jgi:predicted AlkP superfamily phosphohydrolase/phosphomutase|tara:strand:+ start:1943 stop:2560 length:618 start_codon:yes stop_codon:yes gene_type:complete